MSRLARVLDTVRRRGPGYGVYLVTGYLVPRLARPLARRWAGLVDRSPLRRTRPPRHALDAARAAPPAPPKRFVRWRDWPVDPEVRRAVEGAPPAEVPGDGIVLGSFDADGRLVGHFGPLPGLPVSPDTGALARSNTHQGRVELVLVDGLVVVRKSFARHELFAAEWAALAALAGHPEVPALHGADEDRRVLAKALVPGTTVRQRLVEAGAKILRADTDDGPEAVVESGRRLLGEAVPAAQIDALEAAMDRLHRAGVTGFSLTWGNVVLRDGGEPPCLVDLDRATVHPAPRGLAFDRARDRDRQRFNFLYDRQALTEESARHLLDDELGGYAPVDLGDGWASRGFWSVESGTGRWEYLNGAALEGLLDGARVLDLGSHNASMPLMMLRAGAREVVGLELDPEFLRRGRMLHRLVEWRDMRRYDLELHRSDMTALLDRDWGELDLITAFCSLYYLNEETMERMVRRAAELAPMVVLQAKEDTNSETKARRSTAPFLRGLLEAAGLEVELVTRSGFDRPLLIGRRREGGPG